MKNSFGTLNVYLQYYEKEIHLTRILQKAYEDASERILDPVTELEVYIKTEDGKAYYVANGKYECHVNLWDSQNDYCDASRITGEISWKSNIDRRLIFEYRGKQCDCNQVIDRAVEKFVKIHTERELEDVEIYVRQEDETAYYVINGKYTGSVPMYM